MSMTLGFDVLEVLEHVLDVERARGVLVAIAKHSPAKSIRAARSTSGGYAVLEIDRSGQITDVVTHLVSIRAAIAAVDEFVSWSFADEASLPRDLPTLILPSGRWDLGRLHREPAIVELVAADRSFRHLCGSDRLRTTAGPRAADLFAAADLHRMLTVFR